MRRPPQRRRKVIGNGKDSSRDEWRRSTKKVVGNRVESRRGRERTVALLVGDREAVPPGSARGPTGFHRLSPETRVVPFPRLEKGGWSKGRRKGGEGRQARRPGLRGPRRRKLSEGGKPEAETGQKEREEEREEASRSRCLEKHRLC